MDYNNDPVAFYLRNIKTPERYSFVLDKDLFSSNAYGMSAIWGKYSFFAGKSFIIKSCKDILNQHLYSPVFFLSSKEIKNYSAVAKTNLLKLYLFKHSIEKCP